MIRRATFVVVAVLLALTTAPRAVFAQKLSDAELKRLATTATSAADHKKLAAHYKAHAAEHEADAKLHDDVVAAARKQDLSSGHAWELAREADHYAEHSREAAEALLALAKLHEGMAEVATEGAKKGR